MNARHFLLSTILTAGFLFTGIGNTQAGLTTINTAVKKPRLTGFGQSRQFRSFGFQTQKSPDKNAILFRPKTHSEIPGDTVPEFRQTNIDPVDRSGRYDLITATVGYTLIYYGWAVPTAFDAEGGRPYVASYMLLGGSSFFVPFLLTRDNIITDGMARGFTNGAGLGILHGWGLTIAAMGEDLDGRTGLGISVAASLAEGIYSLSYARKHQLSRGHMNLIGNGGIWGMALAAPLPYYLNSENPRAYAISGLLGSGLGIWAGDRLAGKIAVADGDPLVMANAGILGGYLAVATVASLTDNFNQGSLALLMTGTATGLGLGIMKIKKHDYTVSESNLITLGSFAGGLIGLGAVYVASGNASEEAYLWGSAIGAVGGYVLTDQLIRNRQTPKLGNLKIRLNPVALKQVFDPSPTTQTSPNNPFTQPHLFHASLQF